MNAHIILVLILVVVVAIAIWYKGFVPTAIVSGIAILILATVWLALVSGTYLPVLTKAPPYPVFQRPTNWVLSQLGIDVIDPNSYTQVISTSFGVSITVFTVLLTVIPAADKLWYRRQLRTQAESHKRELEATKVVESRIVKERGYDDIDTLVELLTNCSDAIMFAGSFDWLLGKESLKNLVIGLATQKKLTLVTSRERSVVEASLKDIDDASRDPLLARLVDDSKRNRRLLFTFVKYTGGSACCSLIEHPPGAPNPTRENIIVRSEKPIGRALVDIMENLTDIESWKKKLAK